MDAKQVRKLLDDVCADLDRRRAEASALLGHYARPIGLGLALGLGAVGGCASDDTPGGPLDAAVERPHDTYGVTWDLRPAKDDLGVDYRPALVDAYGVAIPEVAADVEDSRPDVADVRPAPVDAYGATIDLPRNDGVDGKGILDGSPDLYGVTNWDAFPVGDAGSIDGGSVEKPKPDAGVSTDSEAVDGGTTG